MAWREEGWGWGWRPYVPVAQRRAQGLREMDRLRKKGVNVKPVKIEGREIARTFWGRAWCEHLEKFSDFANRLPRGRTYVRNGSVCHLEIRERRIEAKVSGSELYDVEISIKTLAPAKWKSLKKRCAGRVGSLLELIQGKLSDQVMALVTHRSEGVFPQPREISLECSCPDYADMCKHVAAVLYGVGARLDTKPELLFLLRNVDPSELVGMNAARAMVAKASGRKGRVLEGEDLTAVFGIDVAGSGNGAAKSPGRRKRAVR
ncbi:MAG: SWIM zinc finger family protein [Planctomycetes bacterium]|nr:SWIM zinc finger family protein [Planctomycetota bacterium]